MKALPRTYTPLQPLLHDLVDRCFSICLHRLRGVRGLLNGWIEIGIPPGQGPRVEARMEEDLLLLARMDWLRSLLHHTPPLKRCMGGEAPVVLLSAALGLGTPEEAGDKMPEVLDPEAAIALALWLQAGTTDYDSASIHLRWLDGQMEVDLAVLHSWDTSFWTSEFQHLLLVVEPSRLRFRASCFAPWPQEIQVS